MSKRSRRKAERRRRSQGHKNRRVKEQKKEQTIDTPRIIKPMTPHERRMASLGAKFLPPRQHPGAEALYSHYEERFKWDLEARLFVKKAMERSRHWLYAQHHAGSGLQMTTQLRWYVGEFCARMMMGGPHLLPSSFNVVEAFLQSDDKCCLFGLRPEKEHLLDADEYFAWYAKRELPREPSLLVDMMEEGVVYSYNLTSSNGGFRVKGEDSLFVLAGISLVRHGHELSCVLLAGEQPPRNSDDEIAAVTQGEDAFEVVAGKEGVAPDPELTIDDRYLDTFPDFARVVVLTRFDLSAGKHDVRYIFLDNGSWFNIITDDLAAIRVPDKDMQAAAGQQQSQFGPYGSLFSSLASLIYLPVAVVAMSNRIQGLEFSTELGSLMSEKDAKDALKELGSEWCPSKRTIRCLSSSVRPALEGEMRVEPPSFEFERTGFWKALAPGEIGKDKNEQPIVGRTWVTRHESWSAESPHAFLLQRSLREVRGPDPGIVYVVRSPANEPNIYKIGLTRRTAEERAKELSSATGVSLPFGVVANWRVGDCAAVEKEVHSRLDANRVNPRREFFYGELKDIVAVINQVVSKVEPPPPFG